MSLSALLCHMNMNVASGSTTIGATRIDAIHRQRDVGVVVSGSSEFHFQRASDCPVIPRLKTVKICRDCVSPINFANKILKTLLPANLGTVVSEQEFLIDVDVVRA